MYFRACVHCFGVLCIYMLRPHNLQLVSVCIRSGDCFLLIWTELFIYTLPLTTDSLPPLWAGLCVEWSAKWGGTDLEKGKYFLGKWSLTRQLPLLYSLWPATCEIMKLWEWRGQLICIAIEGGGTTLNMYQVIIKQRHVVCLKRWWQFLLRMICCKIIK